MLKFSMPEDLTKEDANQKEQKFLTGKQEKYSLPVVTRWKHKNIKPGAIPAHYKII